MKNIKPLVPIVLTLVGLGAGFFGGFEYRNYQLGKAARNFTGNRMFQRFTGVNGQRVEPGMMGAARGGVFGSILSMDDKGITVKLADDSSKIIFFTDATTYSNTVSVAKSDLKTGDTVAVFGATNSDGSVTATDVQINPEFGRLQASPTPAK